MRRRKDRAAATTKKSKASPEINTEKIKRVGRGRRRKQSTSSDNESSEESTNVIVQQPDIVPEVEKPLQLPKEDSPDEKQDQVWQVKTAEGSAETGEIQKLKICLTRPPSTPERVERSPRIKRKHSRATSSSDTPSVEGVEERRKSTRHRTKRTTCESKDETEKSHDSHEEEGEVETEVQVTSETVDEVTQSVELQTETEVTFKDDEKPISTTVESTKTANIGDTESEKGILDKKANLESDVKTSDADTTVISSSICEQKENQDQGGILEAEQETSTNKIDTTKVQDEKEQIDTKSVKEMDVPTNRMPQDDQEPASKVSISEDKPEDSVSDQPESSQSNDKSLNETDVVVSSEKPEKSRSVTLDSDKYGDKRDELKDTKQFLERTDSMQDEPMHNGQTAPIIINRKRRWGSRPCKTTTQKSITISTDILKEIIPDVKPVEFEEVIEEKKSHRRIEIVENDRPILPKIVIDNTVNVEQNKIDGSNKDTSLLENSRETHLSSNRKISIVNESNSIIARPPSPPRHKPSCILYITNLVRPFTLPQLKNLLQRTGRIVKDGFWIDKIKSRCYVKYETEDQAVETRHALHGVTWPVSNPKTLQVDFSSQESFDKAMTNEENDTAHTPTIPGTVEDWLREQDIKRERGELEKPWDRRTIVREWDVGKGAKDKETDKIRKDEYILDRRRHRTPERSPEPAKKFKKKEEEAPAKLLDDLFRKTKTTPCIYWLPLSAETIAVKEEQRRQHMAEHERRLLELRRTHRRH